MQSLSRPVFFTTPYKIDKSLLRIEMYIEILDTCEFSFCIIRDESHHLPRIFIWKLKRSSKCCEIECEFHVFSLAELEKNQQIWILEYKKKIHIKDFKN